MKVAVVGSRTITVDNLEDYLPEGVTEIISGGAKGVDTCAREYAEKHNIPLREYLPEYSKYGRAAPIVRNREIVDAADAVIVIWDGHSKGTEMIIDYCQKQNKSVYQYKT